MSFWPVERPLLPPLNFPGRQPHKGLEDLHGHPRTFSWGKGKHLNLPMNLLADNDIFHVARVCGCVKGRTQEVTCFVEYFMREGGLPFGRATYAKRRRFPRHCPTALSYGTVPIGRITYAGRKGAAKA
eukprot:1156387-Pelagomonas_calceolata.AAC.8